MAWAAMLLDVLEILCQLGLEFQRDDTTLNYAVDAISTAHLSLVGLTGRPG
jgi:hypothetical protein